MDFQIGDRVRLTDDCDAAREGMAGTLLEVDYSLNAVVFDVKFDGGHDCSGLCEDGYGQYVPLGFLEHIEESSAEIDVSEFL